MILLVSSPRPVVNKADLTLQTPVHELHSHFCANELRGAEKMTLAAFGKIMVKLGFNNNSGKKVYFEDIRKQLRSIRGIKLR